MLFRSVRIHAHDALMRWIEAEYGIVDDTAIIEIAQTAGLALIEPEQRNPMKATSWGVGEMIMNAYRRGVRRFIVGLGGSATSDCGIGMLKAMGDDWKKIRQECSFVLASVYAGGQRFKTVKCIGFVRGEYKTTIGVIFGIGIIRQGC